MTNGSDNMDCLHVLRELREAQDDHDRYKGPYDLGLKGAARKAKQEAIAKRLSTAKKLADEMLARVGRTAA